MYKRQLLMSVGIVVGLSVLAQLLYPGNRLLPFDSVDNIPMSGWQKKDAIRYLDDTYKKEPVHLYFGKTPTQTTN